MERARSIAAFWSWLPAFRSVAEYGGIQRAALALHVSPSALSRTIRLLEEAIGSPLFVRSAAGLTLTESGVALLEGTRDAMRRVDDVWSVKRRGRPTWSVGHVGAVEERLVVRALMDILGPTTEGRVVVRPIAEEHVVECLLRGDVDIVVLGSQEAQALPQELALEPIGELAWGYYTTREEPAPTHDRVIALTGVAVAPDDELLASVPSLEAAETLAERTGSRVVLPVLLAPAHFRRTGPSSLRSEVAAIVRRPLTPGMSWWTDELLVALRGQVSRGG